MTGDIPVALYSFETAAIREGRFRALIRPNESAFAKGTILNHGGHRFRVLEATTVNPARLDVETAAQVGFAPGDGLNELQKLHRWWARAFHRPFYAPAVVHDLEALERYSNEPLLTGNPKDPSPK